MWNKIKKIPNAENHLHWTVPDLPVIFRNIETGILKNDHIQDAGYLHFE